MSSRGTFVCALAIAGGLLARPSPSAADYPIFFQRYTADPGTLEWNGRLYLYASHDLPRVSLSRERSAATRDAKGPAGRSPQDDPLGITP